MHGNSSVRMKDAIVWPHEQLGAVWWSVGRFAKLVASGVKNQALILLPQAEPDGISSRDNLSDAD